MAEGIFQNVDVCDDLKVSRGVKTWHFVLSKLEDTPDKVSMKLVISKNNGEEFMAEFIRLIPIPDWVFGKIKVDIGIVMDVVSGKTDKIEELLEKTIDQFEEALALEVGLENGEIYFSVRFRNQAVSIWDKCVEPEDLEGYISIKEGRTRNYRA